MTNFSIDTLTRLLECSQTEFAPYSAMAHRIKEATVGNICYLRGLIEIGNICSKDCLYCGIRRSNPLAERYSLTNNQIVDAALYAHKNGYGSIALQGGEICSPAHTERIEHLLKEISLQTNSELGITLSLGEQSHQTYMRWRKAGATRYLLRIESSCKELYEAIHPKDSMHSHTSRLRAIHTLQQCDFQVGTGVMVGLPGQTKRQLASDLLFMVAQNIDMCGMGPYLEHADTPLYTQKHLLAPQKERFETTLRMISLLRIMLPDINIAATTAMQAIDPAGREAALNAGANVVMPNITPVEVRANYKLYENKPISEDNLHQTNMSLLERIEKATKGTVALGLKGDSLRYNSKKIK